MTPQAQPDTRLRSPWVLLVRAAWIMLAVVTLALFVASIPLVFNELRTVAIGEGTSIWQLRLDEARALEQLGLSVGFYAIYWIVNLVLFVLGFAIVAGVIFWRRSDDWPALFVSLFLLMFGANMVTAVPEPPTIPAVWYLAYKVIQDLVFIATPLFFVLFPDGRFVPGWTRPLAVGWIAFGLIKRLLPFSAPPDELIFLGFGLGALAQLYRYRRVSTAVQRQQTKWVVFGFALTIVVFVGVQLPFVIFPWLRQPGAALYRLPALTVILFSLLVLPVTIGLSILRYRLWDIDLLIRKALVYSALTGALVSVYYLSVVVLQGLFSAVTGQEQSPIVTVISTLGIAALFLPLRRWVQDVIDRRFYRKKYDAQKVLAEFAATCRDETDLDKLTARLVEVVQETMQPERVSLWLKDPNAKPALSHRDASRSVAEGTQRREDAKE